MLPQLAAGVSIASSIAGTLGGLKANKDAKEAIKEQAKLTFMQRQQEIKRLRDQQEGVLGYNRAAVGASNLQMSGSAKRHIDALKTDFAQDIAWRRFSAAKEREAIRKGAPGSAANFGTIASGIGSIGSTLLNYRGKS